MKRLLPILAIFAFCASLFAMPNPFIGTWDSVDRTYRRICFQFHEDGTYRQLVLYPRFRYYDYETIEGRYNYDSEKGIITLQQTKNTFFQADSEQKQTKTDIFYDYRLEEGAPRILWIGKHIALYRDNALSLDDVLSNQMEIQYNLFMDTTIDVL